MRAAILRLSLSLLLVFLLPSAAWAQAAADFAKLGTDNYNNGQFAEAVAAYTQAIQLEPATMVKAYRNLGHTYNRLEQWGASKAYYQYYLELSPDAKDAREIKKKLRRVTRKAEKAGETFAPTETQEAALSQLQSFLETGPYYADQGGALASYKVLLRTEYARPNLAPIQQRLADGLVNEALLLMTPPAGQALPQLTSAQWGEVLLRLEHARGFANATLDATQIEGMSAAARGWKRYLQGDYEMAASEFEIAVSQASYVLPAHWGSVLAAISTGQDGATLETIFARAKEAYGRHEAEAQLVQLQALVLEAKGDTEGALNLLLGE